MVQDRQFAGGPLVPLKYTIREQLASIGDPALTTYPFSGKYSYNANGTISEAEFYSQGSPAAAKRYKYAFPTYDALNRLKSADFSSWSGTAWTSTLAHDLAGITYDADGNLTALQRYRETGTLIDNLTYTIPAGNNRLSSVADAAGVTAETWDAEAGSFTYDASGNLLTAAAPYSITAATYDVRNLPLSLTSGGVTSTYRYDEAGQRIAKQVGAGNTEVYLREGPVTLGVFTVTGAGAVASSFFNILADNRVVGRQPSVGSVSYYHTDLLGSTRSVVQGAAVTESYDFEPWGLLMPGRTLGVGTKEGFTSKERDAESNLDYFGARHYMAALGRWAQVDPPAELFPEWSSYAYVNDDPLRFADPFGLFRCPPDCPTFSGSDALAVFQMLGAMAPAMQKVLTTTAAVNLAPVVVMASGFEGVTTLGLTAQSAAAGAGLGIIPAAIGKVNAIASQMEISGGNLLRNILSRGQSFVDTRNAGNINVLLERPDAGAGFVRATLDPAGSRVISAGMMRADQVKKLIEAGTLVPK